MELLRHRGVEIEAGLASAVDAERFVSLPHHGRVFRILTEIEEQDPGVARGIVDGVAAVLDRAVVRRPILLHGFDATVWPFVELAHQRRWSTRVGLEDGKYLADGTTAFDNAALVAAAVAMFRNALPRPRSLRSNPGIACAARWAYMLPTQGCFLRQFVARALLA